MLLLFTITTIGTRGFVELFPGFADSVFRARPGRLGDADLDGRPRRHLRCGLDAAAAGDRRADPARARPYLGDLIGDPRLYRDRPVLLSRCLASLSRAPR